MKLHNLLKLVKDARKMGFVITDMQTSPKNIERMLSYDNFSENYSPINYDIAGRIFGIDIHIKRKKHN